MTLFRTALRRDGKAPANQILSNVLIGMVQDDALWASWLKAKSIEAQQAGALIINHQPGKRKQASAPSAQGENVTKSS